MSNSRTDFITDERAESKEYEQAVAAAEDAAQPDTPAGRRILRLASSLAPVVILLLAFSQASASLQAHTIAGVALAQIVIAVAVFMPILAVTISSLTYSAIDSLDHADRPAVTSAVLRSISPSVLLVLPVVLLMGIGIAAVGGWGLGVALVLGISLLLHVIMAILQVTANATRRWAVLALSWLAYGSALVLVPTAAWWLPPVAGILFLTLTALPHARRSSVEPTWGPWRDRLTEVAAGLARAIPLWAIPATLWLLAPGSAESSWIVFAALIPAVIGYQAFFELMAGRLWSERHALERTLSERDYQAVLQSEVASTTRQARRTRIRVVAMNVAIAMVAIVAWAALSVAGLPIFASVAAAASAATIASLLALQFSILGSRKYVSLVGLALGTVAVVSVVAQVDPAAFLAIYLVVALVLCVVVFAANRRGWRLPQFHMFWARAAEL